MTVLSLVHILVSVGILNKNVVCAAIYDRNGGNERDLCLFLKFRNGKCAAVAHGGAYLAEGHCEVIVERTCIRNVAINAFNEGKLCCAAMS